MRRRHPRRATRATALRSRTASTFRVSRRPPARTPRRNNTTRRTAAASPNADSVTGHSVLSPRTKLTTISHGELAWDPPVRHRSNCNQGACRDEPKHRRRHRPTGAGPPGRDESPHRLAHRAGEGAIGRGGRIEPASAWQRQDGIVDPLQHPRRVPRLLDERPIAVQRPAPLCSADKGVRSCL